MGVAIIFNKNKKPTRSYPITTAVYYLAYTLQFGLRSPKRGLTLPIGQALR